MSNPDISAQLNLIAQAIFDKKGMNILVLDVRKISTLTDYVVIAEGSVDKHVRAISQAVQDTLLTKGEKPIYVEGGSVGDWIVLDYMHIMIHLFTPGLRERYQLEKLWQQGEIVDVKIDTSPIQSAT